MASNFASLILPVPFGFVVGDRGLLSLGASPVARVDLPTTSLSS